MEVQKVSDNLYYLVAIGSLGGLLLASSLILFYLRYQRRFIRQQAAMQKAELEHKQLVLNSIIKSQEEERIRISKDLHDHVGSTLSGIRFMVARIIGSTDTSAAQSIAVEAKSRIDSIIEDVRSISHSLSPAGLELWGFHEALEDYCEKMSRTSGLVIDVDDQTDGMLKKMHFDDALSLFRVIQELLNNTIKHAAAQHVTVAITADNAALNIRYADDGKGLDLGVNKGRGIGIYNIESRLGMLQAQYEVVSSAGNGYTFIIALPHSVLHKTAKNG